MKRRTVQRKTIEEVFNKHERPLSVVEILEYGRKKVPSLNAATVYRTVKILKENGALVKVSHQSVGTLYERSGKAHHHHFLCRGCRRAYEIPGCSLKVNEAAPDGFHVEDHEVLLLGLCPRCIGMQ